MTSPGGQSGRSVAIDQRTRARRIERWRLERESETLRDRRLAFLRELSGHLDEGFTPAEVTEAQVALTRYATANPLQRDLPLRGGR